MKVQIFTTRQAVRASLFLGGGLFAIAISLSSVVLQTVIGAAALIMIVRLLALPLQVWVRIDARAISWKTPRAGVKNGLPPSGTVAVEDVVAAAVVRERTTVRTFGTRKEMEMRGVRLTLRSGDDVMLPIRATVANVSADSPLQRLVGELRRQHPELASELTVPTM
ncbi:hypothetical protein [Streptomyces sp. WM6378]|uniref:hypothetical protein n=1 Tax=Streptomyces sp. WM6378 TaxID=1415557 RepID=UPI0006AEDE3A|nr:hypothetical protein [Streptomyces sp. WM6378]KOU34939.1 hypothetical protein ADK54_39575 [Streptomyces sp. WM6378]